MFRSVIFIAVLLSAASVHAKDLQLTMGMGLETNIERELNPGYLEVRPVGHVFQHIRFYPWTLALEFGYGKKDTHSGGLRIRSSSQIASAWGRYAFRESQTLSPFVATGFGASFDQVKSSFGEAEDRRSGVRYMGGVGAGLTNVLWDHFMLEAETRVSVVQDHKDPLFAFVLRAGVQL